ncbi:hypothetical protein [Pedococcus sp. 2YAF34]|uniref:hypothetical protein n=1 Tax=Pedococcus sp. 2YAF34 TaxID=3233032 RepID=UPI003F94B14A
MTTYTLSAGQTGVQQNAFGAGDRHPDRPFDTTDTITFPTDVHAIRVRNDSGKGYLFVTVNGNTPQPDEADQPATLETYTVGAEQFADLVLYPKPTGNGTTVKVRRCQPRFTRGDSPPVTGTQYGNVRLPDANLRYGLPTNYSVEAELSEGDQWPAPPVPLSAR